MSQPNGETPTLVNRPSNPVIITTEEEDEDEVTKQLSYVDNDEGQVASNGVHSTNNNGETNQYKEEREVVAIVKSNNGAPIQTDIHILPPPSPSQPVKKSNSTLNNFLNKSRSKVNKITHNSNNNLYNLNDSTHRKKGSGILASTTDLATSPSQFAAGCTLLQYCAIGNLDQVIQYVSNVFPNVNFRDYDRRTALHVASSEGHLHIVQYLISKGARINRTDRWGGSPLDDAHRHRNQEVARYLRSKGGKSGSLNLTTNLIGACAAGDIEGVCIYF